MSKITIKKSSASKVSTMYIEDEKNEMEVWAYPDKVLFEIYGQIIRLKSAQFKRLVAFVDKSQKEN